jgi:hypothetical protein
MRNQSTSFLDDLSFDRSHYYIKKSSIVGKINFNNRIFYPKFQKIDEPLNNLVLSQHLNKEYTIASPLIIDNKTNYLLMEYKGDKSKEFYYLTKHLLKLFNMQQYKYYYGKNNNIILLFIYVKSLSLDDATIELNRLSNTLSTRLTKEWKCLPDISLPLEYNIFTLPYKEFNLSSFDIY